MSASKPSRLIAERWGSIVSLAVIGAVTFHAVLPVAWHYARAVPEPTRWFTPWFVYLATFSALLAVAYVVAEAERAKVREALVAKAKASLGSTEQLLRALGPAHEYPLTRLIYPPPTDEPPDTFALGSWGWLVNLILEAARQDAERILPDVAVFLGDTTHGLRTGQFEERYRLKRDWATEIFGARTQEILSLLASYAGKHQYALDAKREAEMWLKETASEAPLCWLSR